MGLAAFICRRLASALVVLFLVSILTFLIFIAIPNGDPSLRLAGRTATAADIATVRHAYGFDKPIWVQYWRIMKQIFDGSIQSPTPSTSRSSRRSSGACRRRSRSRSAQRSSGSRVGVLFGVIGALRAGKFSDVAITTVSFIGISAPTFVVGAILLYFLTFKATIFPAGGYVPLTAIPTQWFQHLVLPWFTLAILYIGVYAQVLRSSVLDAMSTDAVRTASAKGLSRRRVLIKHVLRVSLIPIVSLWGLDFAAVIGGATLGGRGGLQPQRHRAVRRANPCGRWTFRRCSS